MLGTWLKNYERLIDPQNVYFQGAVEASIPPAAVWCGVGRAGLGLGGSWLWDLNSSLISFQLR